MTAPLLKATARSAEVRAQRSALKAAVKEGEVKLSELLAEVHLPEYLAGMEIAHLLAAIHGVSFKMACERLASLGIPELKPIGRMTYRQRRGVAAGVGDWEGSEGSEKTGRRGIVKAWGSSTDIPRNLALPVARNARQVA